MRNGLLGRVIDLIDIAGVGLSATVVRLDGIKKIKWATESGRLALYARWRGVIGALVYQKNRFCFGCFTLLYYYPNTVPKSNG